ncbi:hypothetical protein BDW69DRAFT_36596 [Aspergillus filifer]
MDWPMIGASHQMAHLIDFFPAPALLWGNMLLLWFTGQQPKVCCSVIFVGRWCGEASPSGCLTLNSLVPVAVDDQQVNLQVWFALFSKQSASAGPWLSVPSVRLLHLVASPVR